MKAILFTVFMTFLPALFTLNVHAAETEPTTDGQDTIQAAPGEKRYVASVDQDGVQRVAIIGGDYFFDPDHIIVKVNVPVEFTVMKVKGMAPHNLIVKAPEAGMDFGADLSASEPAKIKFTPTRTGTYEMICDHKLLFFKSHKERGMKGTIEVVP